MIPGRSADMDRDAESIRSERGVRRRWIVTSATPQSHRAQQDLQTEFEIRAMSNDWSTSNLEDGARDFVSHLEDVAKSALSPMNANIVTAKDKVELERAVQRLRPAFDEVAKWFFDQFKDSRPNHAMYGYEKIWELMSAAFVVGSRGTVTQSAKNYFEPAISKQALSESGKRAVAQSIRVRREKSQTAWQRLALKIAQEKRKIRPSLSKRALAEAVEKGWLRTSNADAGCPVTRGTLEDFFLKKERTGELAVKKVGG